MIPPGGSCGMTLLHGPLFADTLDLREEAMSTAVSERMSTELHRVPRETPVRACLKIMRENDIRHLPVMDGHRFLGLVSEYEILEAVRTGDPLGWAIERLQPTKVVATPDMSVGHVIRKMLDSARDCVVIIDPVGNPDGLFTERDGLHYALEKMNPWPMVREVMTRRELLFVGPEASCAEALAHMAEHKVRHLLVVDPDGRMRGVVSHRDLVGQTGPVHAHVSEPVYIAREDAPLDEPVQTMVAHRIGSLPVVRPERQAVGIVTRSDVLRALVRQLGE